MSLLINYFESKPLLCLGALFGLSLLLAISVLVCFYLLLGCIGNHCKRIHTERVQIIESGHSAELVKMMSNSSRQNRILAVMMGLIVPCTAMLGATAVSIMAGQSIANALVAWVCALTASMTSTICATIVAMRRSPFAE